MKRKDLILAPLCEAILIAIAGLAAYVFHKPFLFASLGPTAYEMIEEPTRRSARPYNVVVGHLIGVLSGFAALHLTHAWNAAPVAIDQAPLIRVLAAVLAAVLTVAFTLLARAQQPAALSTTLIIATGAMERPQDSAYILVGIILITLFGEPLRFWRSSRTCGSDYSP